LALCPLLKNLGWQMSAKNKIKRRRPHGRSAISRRVAVREAYKKILIVCEGEKTEPLYFTNAREFYQLSTVNVEITGEGKDPMSLVKLAKQKYKEEAAGDAYDAVYCVFDKDAHNTYGAAIQSLHSSTPKGIWHSINSVPSFEFWLLLHFGYTDRPFHATGRASAGDEVLKELKNHIPDYHKGKPKLFSALVDKLDTACRNANRVLAACEQNATDNPSTRVHVLVEELRRLKA